MWNSSQYQANLRMHQYEKAWKNRPWDAEEVNVQRNENSENIAKKDSVPLTIIPHSDLLKEKPEAITSLKKALFEHGIVGIRGIEGYQNLVQNFVEAVKSFALLDKEIKESYAPNRNEGFLGYELGKEKFQREDGIEVVDDCKASYYALVPIMTRMYGQKR